MARTRADNYLDSDGNRVNVGNFDSDGLNVNNNWDDNRNDNLGLSSVRNSFLYHPDKIIIRKYRQGVDFLGYVVLPRYRVLRTKTKRRILKKIGQKRQDLQDKLISKKSFNQSLQSYFGVLKHCKGYKIKKEILNIRY